MVGASDGKFVIPLLRLGLRVTAVEIDEQMLRGADHSLTARARSEGVSEHLEILAGDFRDLALYGYDSVWTSCSWHYSLNKDRPVKLFMDCLVRSLKGGGLLGVEYMLPVVASDLECDRYLGEGEIWGYLPRSWSVWEAYTPLFAEAPHPGKAIEHVHRMGFAVVQKEGKISLQTTTITGHGLDDGGAKKPSKDAPPTASAGTGGQQ